ncbi:alpha/beta-hydrolase [Martensiomyces pterosporus]|nr:alpha/beta-hydrolase [Martensiomyces pterosporus]
MFALQPLIRRTLCYQVFRAAVCRSHASCVSSKRFSRMYTIVNSPNQTQHRHTEAGSTTPQASEARLEAPLEAEASGKNSKASVDFVRHVRRAFEEAYGHPAYTSASIVGGSQEGVVTVEYTASVRDFARDTKRKVSSYVVLGTLSDNIVTLAKGTPTDESSVRLKSRSPHEPSFHVVLRHVSSGERYVELWHDSTLAKSIDVSSKHGDFYGDSTFGGIAWSADSATIVYAAERPEFDKAKPDNSDLEDAGNYGDIGADVGDITDDIVGGAAGVADPRRYEFESDWGETFSGKRPPALVVLSFRDGRVSVLTPPPGVSPGQAQLLPDSNGTQRIVFTGYKHTVRKHGIVYCQNRPTGIYVSGLDGRGVECIASGSVRSPRVTPSQKGLVFISTPLGGPHAATSELLYYDFATRATRTLVPVISRPLKEPLVLNGTQLPGGFVGLYVDQLPAHPWIRIADQPERDVLAFTSIWRSTNVVLSLDIQGSRLSLHTPVNNTSSNSILGAHGGLVVGKTSTPAQPEALVIGEASFDKQHGAVAIAWRSIEQPKPCAIQWRVESSGAKGRQTLESIFIYPAKSDSGTQYFWSDSSPASRPLVVQPHGGPHSAYTLDYSAMAAALAKLGFGVLLINFTGSLGFGQDAVLEQIGKMDTLSVDEIQESAAGIQASGEADAKATVYLGGSYSGYTGALLAGLVPGFYRAIVLRNPVISIGENAAMSDIPDWCWAELGLPYDFESPPELAPEVFEKMWKASPSRLVDRVRDPLLLLLGASDRRVPPPQSMSYYYRLKAASAPVQCKVYPSVGHPLDTVEAERDSFVSIARFYAASLKK